MIGKQLRLLRKERKMIQKQLAAFLNMAKSTISQYENDINEPDLKTLVKLADYFDVSTDFLLGRTLVRKLEPEEPEVPKNVAYLGDRVEMLSDNEAEYLRETLGVYRKVRDK